MDGNSLNYNMRRIIGDVHGNMDMYMKLLEDCTASVQVGDFGIGFVDIPNRPPQHRFIRGNHDNPELCKADPNWISDGTYENKTFYLGGAYSIDQRVRTIGKDWWPEEELSFKELDYWIGQYEMFRPQVVITHDGPRDLCVKFWPHIRFQGSRTGAALQAMFEIHQPALWIFGHHHVYIDQTVSGTRFICLPELAYADIPD